MIYRITYQFDWLKGGETVTTYYQFEKYLKENFKNKLVYEYVDSTAFDVECTSDATTFIVLKFPDIKVEER